MFVVSVTKCHSRYLLRFLQLPHDLYKTERLKYFTLKCFLSELIQNQSLKIYIQKTTCIMSQVFVVYLSGTFKIEECKNTKRVLAVFGYSQLILIV